MSGEPKEVEHECDNDRQAEESAQTNICSTKGREDSPVNETVQQQVQECIENRSSPIPHAETHDTQFNSETSNQYDQFLVHGGAIHYPIGFYNISDAQRSDAATVCSGSILEDIEVESVLSQEDHNESKGQHIVLTAAALSSTNLEGHSAKFERFQGTHVQSGVHFGTASLSTKMGPPQNRQSMPNDDDPNAESESMASYTHFKLPRTLDSHSQCGSIKSFGSQVGIEMDDYDGSLVDTETHSIETKSNHSQDEAPPIAYNDNIDSDHHRAVLKWSASGSSACDVQQQLNVDTSIIESSSKLEKVLKIEEKSDIPYAKLETMPQQFLDWSQRQIGPNATIQNEVYDPRISDGALEKSRRLSRQISTKQTKGGERSRSRSRSASPT
jgi:hypothetical protein